MRTARALAASATIALLLASCSEPPRAACTVVEAADGSQTLSCSDGTRLTVSNGRDGTSCTIVDLGDGARLVSCSDGSAFELRPGQDGVPCQVAIGLEGERTIRCGDGTEVTIESPRDGVSCTIRSDPAGGGTLECTDGTSAVLRDGEDGSSCTVRDNHDGTYELRCEDGTVVTLSDGSPGSSCSVLDNGDGTRTIRCDDGTEVLIRSGEDGASCTVADNGDGTSTVSCPDGTRATISSGQDGGACSVTDNGDGTYTVGCSDGTAITIPAGSGAGAIRGTATLPARSDHAGITVRIDGQPVSTSTDSLGAYLLAPISSGIHDLIFEYPGFAASRLESIPVLPGTYEAPPVEVRMGRRIATCDGAAVGEVAPPGTSFLYFCDSAGSYQDPDHIAGDLASAELLAGGGTELGRNASDPIYSAGGAVLFEGAYGGGPLYLHAGGTTTWLSAGSREHGFSPDGGRAYFFQDLSYRVPCCSQVGGGGGGGEFFATLVLVDVATGGRTEVASDVRLTPPLFGSGGQVAFTRQPAPLLLGQIAPESLELWEPAVPGTTVLAPDVWNGRAGFLPDGTLLYVRGRIAATAELVQHDLGTGAETILATGVSSFSPTFSSPDGRRTAFLDAAQQLNVLDLGGGAPRLVGAGWPKVFSADGRYLVHARSAGASAVELLLWDAVTGLSVTLAARAPDQLLDAPFSPDGARLLFHQYRGASSTRELVAWELASSTATVLGNPSTAASARKILSPDGARAVFFEGSSSGPARLVSWDFATGVRQELSPAAATSVGWTFDTTGTRLLFAENLVTNGSSPVKQARLVLWDSGTGLGTTLTGGGQPSARFTATGSVVFVDWRSQFGRGGAVTSFDPASNVATVLDVGATHRFQVAGDHVAYSVEYAVSPERGSNGVYVVELP